ncbi:slipin family protein [Chitinophaga pinensis]|uniref:Band 7 protein n=1 Tax=Chitinophaga pinensis (strain ATCC 43595 / DSM 2588 / LMG 13176 / NBRC 15968 / NCIMB 11800 / UQM 2034) TaxID=485918 RepID=A0A979GN73_CHIPD|nr:slipin family protein [Chitinophaga pinensis]ACU58068.1 band 7 protein [Chitinophaga pinensis DSM 2588]
MISRVKIAAYNKGLVFKENRYVKLLNEGSHWKKSGEDVVLCDMFKPFTPATDLNILLQNKDLADALDVITVNQQEVALVYENGQLYTVLTNGKYAFWKGLVERKYDIYDMYKAFTPATDLNVLLQNKVLASMLDILIIKQQEVGLVYENNLLQTVLNTGKYAYWKGAVERTYSICDMAKPFQPFIDLNLLLAHNDLAERLQIINVEQEELALVYENGLIKTALPAGQYAYWKGLVKRKVVMADLSKYEITETIDRAVLAKSELQAYRRVFNVENYEKAVLYVDGKFTKELAAGTHYFWKNEAVITLYKTDTRQAQLEINGQEILTKDKANIRLNFTVRYSNADIYKLLENKDYEKQLYVLLQLALREQISSYTLDELLDKRDDISPMVMNAVKDKAFQLGVTLLDCGIRDIILPGDVKEIMNQVLIAEKKAQANSIMRREETASTRSLLNTARLMEENEMLFKLKEMEYVEKIADKISSISVSGGDIVGQLKQIFVPAKKG